MAKEHDKAESDDVPRPLTDEQLQLLVSQQEQRRIDQCSAEINRALEKHGCVLVPVLTMIAGRMSHVVNLELVKER